MTDVTRADDALDAAAAAVDEAASSLPEPDAVEEAVDDAVDAITEAGPERDAPGRKRGVDPLAVVGVSLLAGVLLAKVIDWRGHAHPR